MLFPGQQETKQSQYGPEVPAEVTAEYQVSWLESEPDLVPLGGQDGEGAREESAVC